MEKFFTKENVIIVILVFYTLIQSNYFATKLDIANVKLDLSNMQIELKKYSDDSDKEILHDLDNKYNAILTKLEKIKYIFN